jgi:hypothetical protein
MEPRCTCPYEKSGLAGIWVDKTVAEGGIYLHVEIVNSAAYKIAQTGLTMEKSDG